MDYEQFIFVGVLAGMIVVVIAVWRGYLKGTLQ